MKVANLQLQGLLMAIASINSLLVQKGLVEADEIDLSLHKAEANLTGEERLFEDMSPTNRDAVCFPVRFLQAANNSQGDGATSTFSELARLVGQTKEPYNDQQ